MKKKILVIAGPTASGKTALGAAMAKKLDGEVISADSMQIYKGMDIATAKPTPSEMDGIPHHLIDFVERTENYSVAQYVEDASKKAEEIIARGKMPIVVGGTGLYISSFMNNIVFAEIKSDETLRKKLRDEAAEKGNEYLLNRLRLCDPVTAAELHENDLSRVVRALEVFELTGKTMSELKKESRALKSPYDFIFTGITYSDRQTLYDRINRRVDIMMEKGLLDEAHEIFLQRDTVKTAHQAIGCKELAPYFDGVSTLDECLEKIKQETRRYAKRQLTWFRHQDGISWITAEKNDDLNFFIKKCENIVAKNQLI